MTKTATLFSTVPEKDPIGFLRHGIYDYKKPAEILGFRTDDVAAAANVPKNSVRYDLKMPQELKDRIGEWAMAIIQVANFFKGNIDKTMLWFQLPNPMLGNISPRDMIRLGRFKKLDKFIKSALDENQR